jgi:hypothetical protein
MEFNNLKSCMHNLKSLGIKSNLEILIVMRNQCDQLSFLLVEQEICSRSLRPIWVVDLYMTNELGVIQ